MVDGGQNPDFIERVLFLFGRQRHHLHSLEGVGFVVGVSDHLVDRAVGAFSQLRQNLKIPNRHCFFKINVLLTNYLL